MKVSIGPYIDYIGPFQIAEKILFWKDANKINKKNTVEVHKDSDDIYKLCEKLAKTKWLIRLCDWYNDRQKRKISVKLHPYDTWGVDNTLAFIITPILKKLKEDKNGGPYVDDKDVPEELRSTSAPPLTEEEQKCGNLDDNHFKRWDWILDEMAWAFEQHSIDWEAQYESGESNILFEEMEDGLSKLVNGPNHTFKVDSEGIKKHKERMLNGRMLFAKYYECLWA